MIKSCPKCNNDHTKPGLFCSRSCANSRIQTEEINEKRRKKIQKSGICEFCGLVTSSISGLSQHKRSCIKNPSVNTDLNRRRGQLNINGVRVPKSILDMSKRTTSKVLKRLNIGCSNCGWNESSCDVHHIIPKSKGGTDFNDNLTILCPNCHRLAHTNKLSSFISVSEQIGSLWREHYYSHE